MTIKAAAMRKSLACLLQALAISSLLGAVPAGAQTVPLELGQIPPEDAIPLAEGGLAKALAALPADVADILKRSGVPGAAVAVVHGSDTVFSEGFGVREIGKDGRVDPQTVFQIASLSKPIAATVAAVEVTAGVVKWDDKAISYLPSLRLADPYVTANATIGDFYAHRTGLPLAAGDDLEDIGFGRAAIIGRLHLLPLDLFRISYHYANFGITIGAEAVAAASGMSWEDLADKALFVPLGMTSTSFRYADFMSRKNRAALHALVGGHFEALYQRDPDAQAPAGGVSSNVVDLAKWLKLLLADGRLGETTLIAPKALLPAMRPQAFSAPASTLTARSGFYGYGFNIGVNANGRTAMSHSGAFVTGAGTVVQILPSANVAIVVLTNGAPVGAAESIAAHFMDIVQYGAPTRDWFALFHPLLMHYETPVGDLQGQQPPSQPAAAHALDDYVGTYDNAYFGPARIEKEGDHLVLATGPGSFQLPLAHWNGDVFAVAPRTENAPDGSLSSVRFTLDGGKVSSFTVNYLDDHGLATWRR